METMDRGLNTRMGKEIYLIQHSHLETREIMRMSGRELSWWVTTTKDLMEETRTWRGGRMVKALVC